MSETLFIADLHLRPEAPTLITRLHTVLERAQKARALYILGDLLDYWVGDDQPLHDSLRPAFEALKTLADSGVLLYLQHGNRDFLLGEKIAARFGFTLIPEYQRIELDGHPILLCHGDSLCTDDAAYQAMRAQFRHPAFQAEFLAKPLPERLAIATALRERSRQESSLKAQDIMDVNSDAVRATLDAQGCHHLIHGHTHRPALHRLTPPHALRAVLGDWEDAASLISHREGLLHLERIDESGTHIIDQAPLAHQPT